MRSKKTVSVTGGTGFVGIHTILQLLEKGYAVKTTIRNLNRKDEVLEMLNNGGISTFDDLTFVEADLTKDTHWDEAVGNCDYVLHVASPIFLSLPKDENEMIRPAVEGTLRVLKAARDAKVKRVVMTSNFGAVGYSHKNPNTEITEKDWTDSNEKGLSSYNRSKVMAEQAAWDFINKEGGELELSVINPVGIFGPSLSGKLSAGFELLKNLLDGSMKAIPNLKMNVIDVRDVADLHIRAMTNPNAKGQRFLALAGGEISLPQISELLKQQMPEIAKKAPTRTLPDWIVSLGGLFNPKLKNVASMLKAKRDKVSNQKAKDILDWSPISTNEAAILASVESMIKFGNI
ncbi:SDR family oxidoreductase [Flagellimonas pelagia]|uniref:Aldehyde reductase n=1 Tax=Flagellimonas pelagia TaxID=2306998 RepID=A0A3A1NKY1_9FLAO|nr:aldehyde reductase [Allomuricauda maritima]RIV46902.1 aldehyde reductase [Allomuricauda maritima]TXJ99791.1 aldehyde reductase [Allomuricauda maritima]